MKLGRSAGLVTAAAMLSVIIAGSGVTFAKAAESTTMDYAVEVALADAGLKEDDVTVGDVERGREQGASVYEVEFWTDSREYEYYIAVADGEIVSAGWELTDPYPEGSQIAQAKAKKIALQYAGVSENDASFSKASSGTDKGIPVYEIKFTDSRAEYKCDIAKQGGEILNYSRTLLNPSSARVVEKAAVQSETN